jgi:hypothetical protein
MSHICGSKTRPPTDRVTSPYGAHMGLTYQFSISYHIGRHLTSCHTHPNQLISTANPLVTQVLHSRSRLCENSHYEFPLIRNFTTKNRPFVAVVTRPRNRQSEIFGTKSMSLYSFVQKKRRLNRENILFSPLISFSSHVL